MLSHWIWLTRRKGIGIRGRAALLRQFGTAEHIFEMQERDYLAAECFDRRWLDALLDKSLEESEKILAVCDDKDIRIVTYADRAYPDRLRNISDPPTLLYYKGYLPDFDHEATIAVVGSRRCSAYGLLHAKQFSKLIAASGGIIVSGGARGIDSMALRGALDSTMPVACVLGCGVDIVYPPENRYLFKEIAQHGCLISEFPPGTPPERGNFPIRNRIISGLSLGVLVVEAPEKSGALITANLALEQGRDVFAIPGNIGVKQCEGSNRLIREGAIMVENGWEVVREYEYRFPGKLSDGRSRDAIERIFQTRYGQALPVYTPILLQDDIDKKDIDKPADKPYIDIKENDAELQGDEAAVYQQLSAVPLLPDELVARTGIPAQRVLAALTMLQIKKLAVKQAAGRYSRQ